MRAILDAGALIAAWDPKDQHHTWAKGMFRNYAGPFFVTEAVLTEVAQLTGRDAAIGDLIRRGRLLKGADVWEDGAAIARALETFPQCDLADATVIAASERYPRLDVLTVDRRHFAAYRRSDGSPLPCVLPPAD
jgi:predicted nucleic acid-binding protein